MSHTASNFALSPAADKSIKTVPVKLKLAVAFFIGGAADKQQYYGQGPNNNIRDAMMTLDLSVQTYRESNLYRRQHIDYRQAKGDADINEYVISQVPSKAVPIYIVGHSLGAWNGAHLSRILTERGYKVAMLVTLDPVGEGVLVSLGSDIYWNKPEPVADFWINITASPRQPNSSDQVANFGERWLVKDGPNINTTVNINHADAGSMFTTRINGSGSALDQMRTSIDGYLK
jgi:hypothetical protein